MTLGFGEARQGGALMPARMVEDWLRRLEQTLGGEYGEGLEALFLEESYWRDLVALTPTIGTLAGRASLCEPLRWTALALEAGGFEIATERTAPRLVTRAGVEVIEAFFTFETRRGSAEGVVRLRPDEADGSRAKAWTLLTALAALRGHEERTGAHRPSGERYARNFKGPNWLDQRRAAMAYEDRDPAVLVVGGGQAGLSIAARLTQQGVDCLIVDRHPRIGDNWRQRYHALTLHNQVHVNHLPYMPFPPTWPRYLPKDKLANWFEAYVEAMELNYWTATEFAGAEYDQAEGCWQALLRRADGTERRLRPRHIVLATGASGIPNRPALPGLEDFRGTVLHAGEYRDGEDWTGRRAIVVGTGNSGHDIAQDLHASGADVTLVQRRPTLIVNIEPSAQLPYALYDEGPPLEDCDLITAAMPLPLARAAHRRMTAQAREIDRPLLDALERRGFRLDFGEDETGWQFKYLTRGGGYCFNVGCSDLIADGRVALLQFDRIKHFDAAGAALEDGSHLPADLLVLATGYKGQEALVERLFGPEVKDRVGPVWGFGDGLELRNMFARTPQPGLWFIAGSFAQCRIYSKYLAFQIKMDEAGLQPEPST
jgi:putative flavoprotein involved in K+ transport